MTIFPKWFRKEGTESYTYIPGRDVPKAGGDRVVAGGDREGGRAMGGAGRNITGGGRAMGGMWMARFCSGVWVFLQTVTKRVIIIYEMHGHMLTYTPQQIVQLLGEVQPTQICYHLCHQLQENQSCPNHPQHPCCIGKAL